jgi:hypothetical protein
MPDFSKIDLSQRHPVAFALVGLAIAAAGFFLAAQKGG